MFPELAYHSFLWNKSLRRHSQSQSHKETPHWQTSASHGLHKASWDGDVSFKAKERNLSERRSGVTGALLISSQIKSQLFAGNKDSQWGNQPPKGQMVSVQSPLTPSVLASRTGLRVLQARQATQQIHNPQSITSCDTVLPVWLKAMFLFSGWLFFMGCLTAEENHECQIW